MDYFLNEYDCGKNFFFFQQKSISKINSLFYQQVDALAVSKLVTSDKVN